MKKNVTPHLLLTRLKVVAAELGCAGITMLLGSAGAQPNVAWQNPVPISGTADVSTHGVYFGSWAPQDGSAANHPVNGVTFQGFSDLPSLAPGPTFDNGL
jgi:hypothetical protein